MMTTQTLSSMTAAIGPAWKRHWRRFAAVAGPGLVVMLADTDAGSVITAAQSGAQWGYRLLLLQLVLIPILFVVQELTVRLGIVSGMGHGELIRQHFGRGWAWISVGTLALACGGALLSELSGLAGVGMLFGVPVWVSMPTVVGGLIAMVVTRSYLSVERIALAFGAFELVFIVVAWRAHPQASAMLAGSLAIPWRDTQYLYLAAANVGAVIMPWMVFYQQSSVVEKKLGLADLRAARWDTAIGAVLTQAIMAAVLAAVAAALGRASSGNSGRSLDTVQQIAEAITPVLGQDTGRLLFAFGMSGAALVATIVVALTAARSLGEVLGVRHTLDLTPRQAPWFYGIFAAALIAAGMVVACDVDLVSLSVGVQVMNALLLPVVLGFLYLLARRLPAPHRLSGPYAVVVGMTILVTAGFGVYAGIAGIL